ncbi:MAG: InlB B-repeat-containing protein [Firmicutes bacterium]|nr:InlB B-repeat-containing protein [Bacillota bacterium]
MKKKLFVRRMLVGVLILCLSSVTALSGLPEQIVTDTGLQVSAASYPKLKTITYTKTGNQKNDIIGFAKTQVGYAEASGNNTYFGHWFGLNYAPWCAMFVSWCAAKAGVSKSVVPRLASADRSWAKNQKVYYKSKQWGGTYTPQKGDLIYFSWSVRDYADHIGMVTGTSVSDGKTYVNTIEGNKRDKVVTASYLLSNKYILGYAHPKYTTGTEEQTQTTTTGEPVPFTLKYRDGLIETDNDEEDAIIQPTEGTFGQDLTLSDLKFTRTGYKYTQWMIYRENSNGELIYLCRDNATSTKEKWKTSDAIPSGYSAVRINLGGALKINTAVSGVIYAAPDWAIKKYKVTYDVNGGRTVPSAQKKTYGKALKLTTKKPTWAGYRFLGWSLEKKSGIVAFRPGDKYTKNKAMTLYAVWKPLTTSFKVKVVKKGGTKLRSGPAGTFKAKNKVKKGKQLRIVKIKNGWGKIKGKNKWIKLKFTKQIK